MPTNRQPFLPEGELFCRDDNKLYTSTRKSLEESMILGRTLEAPCIICDNQHNLIVDFGFCKGIIQRSDGAIGIDTGATRDIALISRVNKPVCFKVIGFSVDAFGHEIVMLSRKLAQEECVREYISKLRPGEIIDAKVTHLEPFGAFVDMGCGLPSLIPIDFISVSRIAHPADRFYINQMIKAAVRHICDGKITLTHKELLGTWEENAASFNVGATVTGIVRSVESYGVFVELTPNLAGLAEVKDNVRAGQQASVYIKAIIPEKMKIKLIIVDTFDVGYVSHNYEYRFTAGKLDRWIYSTQQSGKIITTDFHDQDACFD
jgi:small subunit ribosomal protein S1